MCRFSPPYHGAYRSDPLVAAKLTTGPVLTASEVANLILAETDGLISRFPCSISLFQRQCEYSIFFYPSTYSTILTEYILYYFTLLPTLL